MKKSINLSIAALAALSVLSCQKENNGLVPEVTPEIETNMGVEPNPNFVPTKAITFVGTVDDEVNLDTKTSLDGTHIKWAAHEGIYLFDAVAPRAFTSNNEDVASTVNFTGNASAVEKYYAVYPSGTLGTNGDKKVISTTIPTFQTATANSFAPKANVAVAYSANNPTGDGALQFKNVGAVVKFKLHANNDDVRKVRLEAIGEEDLTGAMDVTFESDGTFSSSSVHSQSQSCAILESDSDLNPSNTYYIAIKPGLYASGFKLTLIKADGSFRAIKNSTSNTLDRNDLMDFGTLPEITDENWKKGDLDEITSTTTGITGNSYTDFSGKTATSSAVYAGKCAGTYSSVQLRSSNNDSGIVTTASGGTIGRIVVEWNSNTVEGRTLNIYGKASAYSAATQLFSEEEATSGKLLGTIICGTSTELTVSGTYAFVGVRSDDGALYMDKISFIWGDVPPADPAKLVPSTTATDPTPSSVGLTDGSASFTVTSNVPWTIASSETYASVSVSGSTVTVDFANLASGSRSATITVTPAEGTPVSKTITQTNAAEPEEKNTNSSTGTTDNNITTIANTNSTVVFQKLSTGNTHPNVGVSSIKLYVKSTVTVSSDDYYITKVEFTCKSNQGGSGGNKAYPTGFTTDYGSSWSPTFTFTGTSATYAFTPNTDTKTIVFTCNGDKGNIEFTKVKVYYK